MHLIALRVQEQALFARMGSESHFELLHSRVKSVQAPTISGPNIGRIETKQAGYSESVYCNCEATKSCQEPMKTLCRLCYLLTVFLHGTANLCARCSRSSKANGCRLRQESGAWQPAHTRCSIVVNVLWTKNTDFKVIVGALVTWAIYTQGQLLL